MSGVGHTVKPELCTCEKGVQRVHGKGERRRKGVTPRCEAESTAERWRKEEAGRAATQSSQQSHSLVRQRQAGMLCSHPQSPG